ncbi:hypothetical protein PHLH8_42050 [Pseudomonas sp. Pc102]|nr:hypothetical protein PHLH8_42050 [Pseudomonas sp. Pc102]
MNRQPGNADWFGGVESWDDDTPLDADEIELPFYKEVELSGGKGSTVVLQTTGRKLRFGKYSLRKKNIDAASAACVTVNGNSMEPVLPDGSTVGVDTSARTIKDGDMYAFDHDGQLRVKLLYRLPGAACACAASTATSTPTNATRPAKPTSTSTSSAGCSGTPCCSEPPSLLRKARRMPGFFHYRALPHQPTQQRAPESPGDREEGGFVAFGLQLAACSLQLAAARSSDPTADHCQPFFRHKEKGPALLQALLLYGALRRIRTSDRPVRSRVLYPAEL